MHPYIIALFYGMGLLIATCITLLLNALGATAPSIYHWIVATLAVGAVFCGWFLFMEHKRFNSDNKTKQEKEQ